MLRSRPLLRLLLAAKALSLGRCAMVELEAAEAEAEVKGFRLTSSRLGGVVASFPRRGPTAAWVRRWNPKLWPGTEGAPVSGGREVPSSTFGPELEGADAHWGAGVAEALAPALAGSSCLVAVPPSKLSTAQQRGASTVLLLEISVEVAAKEEGRAEMRCGRRGGARSEALSEGADGEARGSDL